MSKRQSIVVEMEQAIRNRISEMQDSDEMAICYTVDVIRNGEAVTGEGGDRMYTKDEISHLVHSGLLRG